MITPEQVTPEVLTAALRHLGWFIEFGNPGVYESWALEGLPDALVTVPLDNQRGDYESLMRRALSNVLRYHGRTASETLELLVLRESSGLEQSTWQKESPVNGGLIDWLHGEALIASIKQLLTAAAKSAAVSRERHGNASSFIAKSFLDAAYMGQTEVGSFVVTAYAPVRTKFYVSEQMSREVTTSPSKVASISGREIMDTLKTGIETVRACLDDFRIHARPEIFREAVTEGVSYELADAIRTMSEGGEVNVTIGSDTPQSTAFAFRPSDIPALERAREVLDALPEPVNRRISGEVTLLEAGAETLYRTVRLNVGEPGLKTVRVHLTEEQYQTAIDAHRNHRLLSVSGKLTRESKRWWLYNAGEPSIGDELTTPRPATSVQDSLLD